MYLVKTPWYIKAAYPSLIWRMREPATLYLSFDDGPLPGVTDEILKMLDDHNAKATFFVVGENVARYPQLFEKIKQAGHSTGNHTMHHVNGWKTTNEVYYREADDCNLLIGSKLFRPPYGRIRYGQIKELKKQYSICMWDVLSGDFDKRIDAEKCIKNVVRHATDGSIVVFHDSNKAKERVLRALPAVLTYFAAKNYTFKALPQN